MNNDGERHGMQKKGSRGAAVDKGGCSIEMRVEEGHPQVDEQVCQLADSAIFHEDAAFPVVRMKTTDNNKAEFDVWSVCCVRVPLGRGAIGSR